MEANGFLNNNMEMLGFTSIEKGLVMAVKELLENGILHNFLK